MTTAISAPFQVITGVQDSLRFAVDGGVDQDIVLVPDDPAEIIGHIPETFDIHAAQAANLVGSTTENFTIPAVPGNVFDVFVDGVGYRVSLTVGSRTAAQVAAEIDSAGRIDGAAGTFGAAATASDNGSGSVRLVHDTVGEGAIVVGSQTALNAVLGFTDEQNTDDLTTTRGVDANNEIRFLVDDTNAVVVSLTNGVARTAADVATDIDTASVLLGAAATTIPALPSGTYTVLSVFSEEDGEDAAIATSPLTAVHEDAMATLGLTVLNTSRGTYVSLDVLHEAVDALSGISSERSFNTLASGGGGTALLSGPNYVLRLPGGTLLDLGVTTADKLRIAVGENAGWYEIASITQGINDDIEVARPLPATTGDEALNQQWEIHRDLLIISSDSEDTNSSLEVKATGFDLYSEVGLVAGEARGTVSGVRVKDAGKDQNFESNDVSINDILTFAGPTYATQHTVTALVDDALQPQRCPGSQPHRLHVEDRKGPG